MMDMDIEYVDVPLDESIYIDENYYSLPTPKPKTVISNQKGFTLEEFDRQTKNRSPAKACMVEIASLAQLNARYK
jgi:hypothetical protein